MSDWGNDKNNGGQDIFVKIANNVQQLNVAVRDINNFCNQIGTAKDSSKLRDQLKKKRDETQQIVVDTKALLSGQFSRDDKLKKDKLVKQFNDILEEYEKIVKLSIRKEREVVEFLRDSIIGNRSRSSTEQESQLGLKLNDIKFGSVDEAIINEQNQEIKELEENLSELAECFVDIHTEVVAQGEQLNRAEGNIKQADQDTYQGTKEIHQAGIFATKARIKVCIIISIILVIIIAIILAIVFTLKH